MSATKGAPLDASNTLQGRTRPIASGGAEPGFKANYARVKAPYILLSPREREVLRLIAHGYSMAEVAERLSLSIKTVDTYKTRLMEKLGATKKSELVSYALKYGLLSNE